MRALGAGTVGHNQGPSRTALEGHVIYESAFLLALSDLTTGQGTGQDTKYDTFSLTPLLYIYPTGAEYASQVYLYLLSIFLSQDPTLGRF